MMRIELAKPVVTELLVIRMTMPFAAKLATNWVHLCSICTAISKRLYQHYTYTGKSFTKEVSLHSKLPVLNAAMTPSETSTTSVLLKSEFQHFTSV